MNGRIRQALSPALVLLGVILLVYVGAQYGRMYSEQHRLAREWQHQQQNRTLHPDQAPAAQDDGLIRISVPKIDLDSVIVEGTSNRDLLLGPGHMANTPAPGDSGNAVITGHRDTFFRHIHELQKGDIMVVQRDGKTFRYEVTGKKVVEPTDLSVLRQSHDSEMTLITCYPTYYIGPAPKRLVVFSRMLAADAQTQSAASGSGGN